MNKFIFSGQAQRIVFGVASLASLPAELDALKLSRALILSTPEQAYLAESVRSLLGVRGVGIFTRARMHVPVETVAEATEMARLVEADCTVAIGGGSTTGLAKAVALESDLPVVAIPTTYAGSEVTSIYGLTAGGVKRTGRDSRVLPKVVIYDPELTLSLPLAMTLVSGLNGIAHAAEALYAHDGNPITSLMAEEGIRAIAGALPVLKDEPTDVVARGGALYGAWLCGAVLGQVSIGLHHKLCHTLGGSFDLPHAETHAIVLPHALAYNADAAPEAMKSITRALGALPDGLPAQASLEVFKLSKSLGAPTALRDIGLPHGALDRIVELACDARYPNPRPLDRPAIRALLERAYLGLAPAPG